MEQEEQGRYPRETVIITFLRDYNKTFSGLTVQEAIQELQDKNGEAYKDNFYIIENVEPNCEKRSLVVKLIRLRGDEDFKIKALTIK